MQDTAIVIPARYGSSRFPGKPLYEVCGWPLLRYVYETACRSEMASAVYIATDDDRIRDAASLFCKNVILTSQGSRTGSDRIAEAVSRISASVVVNLQGDEFLSSHSLLDSLIERFLALPDEYGIGTVARRITDISEVNDTNVVKVVTGASGDALYFSRLPIPYVRDEAVEDCFEKVPYYKHYGIYIYRRDALFEFASLKTGRCEDAEKLEQLRALEAGMKIKVFDAEVDSVRVDTPSDLDGKKSFFEKLKR